MTPMGLYKWKALTISLNTLGAVFQQLINLVLGDLQPRSPKLCIDNITIFSPKLEQQNENVDCLLERLNVDNLKVNFNKCSFSK